jgi:hypothetical protein
MHTFLNAAQFLVGAGVFSELIRGAQCLIEVTRSSGEEM